MSNYIVRLRNKAEITVKCDYDLIGVWTEKVFSNDKFLDAKNKFGNKIQFLTDEIVSIEEVYERIPVPPPPPPKQHCHHQ